MDGPLSGRGAGRVLRGALALVLLGTALAGAASKPAAPELRDLRSLADFAREFGAAKGAPRLVLLLSPT